MGPEGWCGVWFNWRFGDMFEKVLSIAWVVWCGDILSLRLERHYCVFLIKWWHGDRKQWRNFHSHSSARSPLTYSEMLSCACADTRTSTAHTLTSVRLEICLKNCDQVILTTNSDLGLATMCNATNTNPENDKISCDLSFFDYFGQKLEEKGLFYVTKSATFFFFILLFSKDVKLIKSDSK